MEAAGLQHPEIHPKTALEIEGIRHSGQITSACLTHLVDRIQNSKPGELTPLDLDKIAAEFITRRGAVSAFHGFSGFPNHICVSVNDTVIHGVPTDIPLWTGDIVSIDAGVIVDGWYSDAAITVPIGDWHELDPEVLHLLRTTYQALQNGIEVAEPGRKSGLVSATLQATIEAGGCTVVPGYDGHGIGRDLHEGPEIPSWGSRRSGRTLPNGIVICIEPLATTGSGEADVDPDDTWSVLTVDGTPACHYEQTVAVTDAGVDVLTPYNLAQLPFLKPEFELEAVDPRPASSRRFH